MIKESVVNAKQVKDITLKEKSANSVKIAILVKEDLKINA